MRRMALVGSSALQKNGHPTGQPRDYDFICFEKDFKEFVLEMAETKRIDWVKPSDRGMAVRFRSWANPKGVIYEAEFVEQDDPSSIKIYNHIIETGQPDKERPESVVVADLDTLYLLKMSHRFKKNSPHFLKTMEDIHYMRSLGAEIRDEELLKIREAATLTYSHPDLNVSKEEFFVPMGNLEYVYDHDSLHEAVAFLDRPMYTLYAKENEQVLSDKDKFFELPELYKFYAVLEEAYVLALERSVIPFATSPDKALLMALEKICTSVTSGWFREYAWENYYQILKLHENLGENYVKNFNEGLGNGKVKLYSTQ
ncbi:hypothetical protein EKI60_05820 [Candidatus Saccharibacteria bacterium]|nr:MAG: hypothetical protein EKI60_05820 [Candidatus Saccharibacteria bacterium]